MFLEVKNLTKSFGETQVLRGINFGLEKGQVLCFWVNRDVWKGPKVPLMEKGQPTEQSFMAVTMENNKITFTRFGAGNDYKFKIK